MHNSRGFFDPVAHVRFKQPPIGLHYDRLQGNAENKVMDHTKHSQQMQTQSGAVVLLYAE